MSSSTNQRGFCLGESRKVPAHDVQSSSPLCSRLVELTPELAADAQALLLRHALRSSDAVQLASSLYLQREIGERILFAAFDDRLNSAARAEGLTLIDLS